MAKEKDIPVFEIDEKSDLPIWVQIRDRFVYLIASGYYQAGDQLPSVRKVAAEARTTYNTVSKAYMSLEREGRIETRHGSGAYVCERVGELSEFDVLAEEFVKTCQEKGMNLKEIAQLVNKTIRRIEDETQAQ